VVAGSGEPTCASPESADTTVPVDPDLSLALGGRLLQASEQKIVAAFAAQVGDLLERQRLAQKAEAAAPLEAANEMRTALLAAVGHDLRTPLATVKAVTTSLLSHDVVLTVEDREELLVTADEALDRLTALVDNLLDMSRLQAGAIDSLNRPTAADEVVARALDSLADAGRQVVVDLPDGLPEVLADPGLLERVLANLLVNAARYSPAGVPPTITGSHLGSTVELRVIDKGPGIPPSQLEDVFLPFQRLGDTDNTTGVGLGLALARGLVELMGGTLQPEETPGGGLTMVVSLNASPAAYPVPLAPGRRERTSAADEPAQGGEQVRP
jgi:two-component system sensor histidine kinase KdpD